jgi:S1-C subfamily serine protease
VIIKICCVLAAAILWLSQTQIDVKEIAADAQDSVVKIMLVNSQGQVSNIGTGFFVGKGNVVATAAHVYLEGERQIIDGAGGQLILGKTLRTGKKFFTSFDLVGADYTHDVALLRFDPQNVKRQIPDFEIKPLELDEKKPSVGDSLIFVGYFGNDEFPLLSRTVVSGFTNPSATVEQVVLDLPANPGQSGSPVISLESGKVVGVLASFVPVTLFPGVAPTHSGLSRSVEVEHLKRLIGSAEVR